MIEMPCAAQASASIAGTGEPPDAIDLEQDLALDQAEDLALHVMDVRGGASPRDT